MNKKTVAVTLGSVDAFCSHSWSDDGSAKFDELHKWAGGTKKFIWLDKVREPDIPSQTLPRLLHSLTLALGSRTESQACIDQTDIDRSLACLPVFLAGCRQLLILAGPTYATRLWCVMEIFVFVRMGGKHEDMLIRLLDNDEALATRLQNFDAGKAKCYLSKDRHKLWAVIEASFGDFIPFNKIVRDIFTVQLNAEKPPLSPGVVAVDIKH